MQNEPSDPRLDTGQPASTPPSPPPSPQTHTGWPMQPDPSHFDDGHTYAAPGEEQPLPVCDYSSPSDGPCEEPTTQKRWSSAAVIISATLGALAGGLLVTALAAFAFGIVPGVRPIQNAASTLGPLASSPTSLTIEPSGGNTLAEAVAKKATPAVVNVKIEAQGVNQFGQPTRESGNGSGVLIRTDGHILTNNHVVEGADKITVTVGVTDHVAKVVGTDPSTDLAVIKIDGGPYSVADIGESKTLQVGDFVMAVGSPFGLEKTVTSGIVSALQRSEQVQNSSNDLTTYTNLIQTDAAINPGNSGGALVNDQGKLVGINTLIQSPLGGVGAAQSAGIGFAIPVDFAKQIAEQLITSGKATHPYIGVSTETIDQSVAQQFNLPVQRGAFVRFVSPGSPAEKAGIKADDIVIKIGDKDIGSVEDVFAAIRQYQIGQQVDVVVVRGNAQRTLQVTLGNDANRTR